LPIPPRTGAFGQVEQEYECQYIQTDDYYLFRLKQLIDLQKTKAAVNEDEIVECYMLMWNARDTKEFAAWKTDVASIEMACRAFFNLMT
jgi:hypothetical protein